MDEVIAKYKWLLFLQRLAFILNILFIVCLVLRYTEVSIPELVQSITIIPGWIISPFLNFIILFIIAMLKIKENRIIVINKWATACSVFIFVFQIFYFIIF